MANMECVIDYVTEVRSQFASGHAREHAYRPALQRLMRSFDDIEAVNDPKQSEHGAPDFVFQLMSNRDIVVGYAEAKDIHVDLDKVENSDQMKRYSGYRNLFLTNYLEFRFYQDGVKYQTIKIGEAQPSGILGYADRYDRLCRELREFFGLPAQSIVSGIRLAQIMGSKARRIRDDVEFNFGSSSGENNELARMYALMRNMLVHDLDFQKFADMYAQTLVYGLFVARYNDQSPDTFSRDEARLLIPKSNPFLRNFFDHIAGPNFDDRLARAVDELCEVFVVSDVRDLVDRHLKLSSGIDEKDPIIHFYEDFLEEYDPLLRRSMGAYYTPLPVARYMVRQVDKILKQKFGLKRGLADKSRISKNHRTYLTDLESGKLTKRYRDERVDYSRVQVLDPAVGTATFLNEVVQFIRAGYKGQEGLWPEYVEEHLLPRINGFELMMAPYTIAHLKIGMTLAESGVDGLKRRLGIYLTNTLEEGVPHQADLFSFGLAESVTEESREANRIKTERPIMVVIGNPPWSGVSSNETKFANSLVDRYKVEPGGLGKLKERKHWLNDDYVKFLSFAEQLVAKNGEGVVAMITNHGYLENVTFRGMRWQLARTFDEIYVVDLHGSLLKGETALAGLNDQNVFDIRPGAAIIFGVKRAGAAQSSPARVNYAELWGSRKAKFDALDADDLEWTEVTLDKKYYYFAPKSTAGKSQYEEGISLEDLFLVKSTAVLTMGDGFAVATGRDALFERVRSLVDGKYDAATLKHEFKLGKNYGPWALENAQDIVPDTTRIVKYAYRPFDYRYIYYDPKLVWRHRDEVMRHLIGHPDNFGIVFCRQTISEHYAHILCFEGAADDSLISNKSRERGYTAPLYLFQEDGTRTSNFSPRAIKALTINLDSPVDDLDVLDYIYGSLHSSSYREKFADLLAQGFPRVPVPLSGRVFHRISEAGRRLRLLHLMKDLDTWDFVTSFPVAGTRVVDGPLYRGEKVWINDAQYFEGVPEGTWSFQVGGYIPAQKWLKDRKGKLLSGDEIEHYQHLIRVLTESRNVMSELDVLLEEGVR